MDRAAIERLVKEAYATRVRGDIAAIKQVFAEHPRFEMAGSPEASPACFCVEGKEGFDATLRAMVEVWEWQDYELKAILIDGNRAAVHWRARMRHTGKDETVETEAVDLLTIENGRVAAFHEFCDTALAAKLMA